MHTWNVSVIWNNGLPTSGQAAGDRADAVTLANGWIDAAREERGPFAGAGETEEIQRIAVAVVLGRIGQDDVGRIAHKLSRAEVIILDRSVLSFGSSGGGLANIILRNFPQTVDP